jgi:ubiquinone/menaquinone biosynthesis C-methylase UbiE
VTNDERVALIRPGAVGAFGTWADLGAGSGAFTLALAAVLGDTSQIYAVDRDAAALRALEGEPGPGLARVRTVHSDIMGDAPLPPLDGILMANSLHFLRDACAVLSHVTRWLKPDGRLIVVEYDIRTANPWVPNPIPWSSFPAAAECAGLAGVRLLGRRPSRYHQSMYAALALRRGTGANPR